MNRPRSAINVVEVEHDVVFGEVAQVVYTDVIVEPGNVITVDWVVVLKESEVVTTVEVSVGDETQTAAAMVRKSSKDDEPKSATHKTNG